MTVYGIPNCDTTKKAVAVLKKNEVVFLFHDYKINGITKEKLKEWIDKVGLEIIFNKRSTTWKELSEEVKKKAELETGAIEIMMANNSIIKRPIIETVKKLIVGFKETEIKGLLTTK